MKQDSGIDVTLLPSSDPSAWASILLEALPYIQKFMGKCVVVKYGGNVLGDSVDSNEEIDAELDSFAEDIVLLHSVGILPVIVHGGGPQIDEWLNRIGKVSAFSNGLRVTDAETLEVVKMVLLGKLNPSIVQAINRHGDKGVGVSGLDSSLIVATKAKGDIGFVGDIESVNPEIILSILKDGLIPVVATIGADSQGQGYNINADFGAAELAVAIGAEKLVYMTNVEGVRGKFDDPTSLIQRMQPGELENLLGSDTIQGGMRPKLQSALSASNNGVSSVHILDGRIPHAILLEMLTDRGIGTMITEEVVEK